MLYIVLIIILMTAGSQSCLFCQDIFKRDTYGKNTGISVAARSCSLSHSMSLYFCIFAGVALLDSPNAVSAV